MNRGRAGLHGSNQCMTDFMIRNNFLFFGRDDGALALIACNHGLNGFLKVLLNDFLAAFLDGKERAFINDIGEFRTAGPAGGQGNGTPVNVFCDTNILGMHLENGFASGKVRELDRDPAVKSTGSEQGLIQTVRTVGCGKNDDTLGGIEAVHFGQQLIERLFAFIVSADAGTIARLADSINFIDKHDARRFLCGLLKQIPNAGRAHADKHFNKF